jgi:very-short-patch-repair endonuclease
MSTGPSTLEITRKLDELARRQLGLVTADQAGRLGIAHDAILRRVDAQLLERLHAGVYRRTWSPKTFEQSCLAACLAAGPHRAVLSGKAAARVHGWPVGLSVSVPEIVLPHGTRFRGGQFGSEVTVRQARRPFASQPWLTGRIATVSSTLCTMAADTDRLTLARCLDHALVNRTVSVAALLKDIADRPSARFTGRKGLVAELAKRADGRARRRSLNERRVNGWLRELGVRSARPNFVVQTPHGGIEVDFAWPDRQVALEVSPFHTHGSEQKQKRDAVRRRALVAAGWRVIEAVDDDITTAAAFAPTALAVGELLGA